MTPDNNLLTRFLVRLSAIIAVLVGISLPIGYGLIAYHNLAESLVFKARIKAHGQGELIATMPDTWMYAENRIQGILKREPVVLDNELVQLYDSQGTLITSTGTQVSDPKLQRSYPLYDIDKIVGQVVISASLFGIIGNTVQVSLVGLVLGLLVLMVMRLIPIRQQVSEFLHFSNSILGKAVMPAPQSVYLLNSIYHPQQLFVILTCSHFLNSTTR